MSLNEFRPSYANSIDPLIPEHWANESILILEEEMVMGNLVHRDFSPIVANYGETIHTRKPSEFVALRKTNADAVTTQDVSATDVEVKLDQWVHVSFVIKDGEQTKAFKDLVAWYLQPAMVANARLLDQALTARVVDFLDNRVGALEGLDGDASTPTPQPYLIAAREELNRQKAYLQGRNLVLAPRSESEMLLTDLFISAERVGDGGRALREASLGRKFGFNCFMDLNTPSASAATKATATTLTEPCAAGATLCVAAAATNLTLGTYFTVAGDMTPLRVKVLDTLNVTTNRPLLRGTADNAVVQPYANGAVDLAAGYAAGYVGRIHVDGTGVPHVGQLVAFTPGGTTYKAAEYVITNVIAVGSDYEIMLDRPLVDALADNDIVNYGPNGDFNLAFHRNAIALVNRPLALPIQGTGARSAVASYNGMSMRVTITYDGLNQGHRVTVDSLFGVKTLDTDLGAVLLG